MKLHGRAIVAFTIVLTGATPAFAQSASDEKIAVRGAVLAATLTLPAGAGPHPAVLLLSGSGPSTRQSLKKFSTQLNADGFATLVFDKRGSGESTGSWTSASFEDNVADAATAIATLQQDSRIDRNRVGVWGVSQAGWFIPALAVRTPSLAFAIVLTGGGATPREVEMFMHEAALERAGVNAADRARAREMLELYFAWLGTGVNRQGLVDKVAAAKAEPWYKAVAIDGVLPSDEGRPAWEWVARYDPMTDIQKMTLPTLVMLGAEDLMGSPAVAAERWKAGLTKARNTRSAVTIIPGMGHAATIGSAHAQGGAVMPEYTKAVSTFLAAFK
jgi:uncharacterized protein